MRNAFIKMQSVVVVGLCISFLSGSAILASIKTMSHDQEYEIRKNLVLKRHELRMKTADCVRNPSSQVQNCKAIECPSSPAVPYKSIKCKSNECEPTVNLIKQCHFEGKNCNGIILDRPGIYKLAENIVFKPCKERTQAIAISSSNVTLDLGPFTLSQGNKVQDVYGIAVCRDVSCIKITGVEKEAKVLDFSLVGIRVLGRTDTITLENVTVAQSKPRQLTNDDLPESCTDVICVRLNAGIIVGEGDMVGLFMKGTSKENRVKNLSLRNITQRGSVLGCQIVMAFHTEVLDSYFTENTWIGLVHGIEGFIPGNFFGIEFPVVDDGIVRNTHVDKNIGDNGGLTKADGFFAGFCDAFALNEVRGFTVENCTFNDNFNTAIIVGADHDGAHDITWRNCEFYRNRSAGGFLSDGFHFSGFLPFFNNACFGTNLPVFQDINLSVDNCVSADNGGGLLCTGFNFIGTTGACVTNCCAEGQNGLVTTSGFGVVAVSIPNGSSENFVFENCIATRNGNDAIGGGATGFLVTKSCSNIIFRNCTANSNANSNALTDFAAGFWIAPYAFPEFPGGDIFNITIDNCIANANGNVNQNTDVNNTSGGVIVKRTPVLPGEVVNIINLVVQDSTVAYNQGNGIFFDDITGGVINNNNVYQNTKTGIDVSAVMLPNTALVLKNLAYANIAGNYAGVPGGNIVFGTTAALPLPPAPGLLNVSIIP